MDKQQFNMSIQEADNNSLRIGAANRIVQRAKTLVTAAEHSVGSREAPEAARMELKNYLRYIDPNNQEEFANQELLKHWLLLIFI